MATNIKHSMDLQLDLFTPYVPVIEKPAPVYSITRAEFRTDFANELEYCDGGRYAQLYSELDKYLSFFRRREKELDHLLSLHDID